MWIVEVNVLGRRFTYQTHDHADKLRHAQRNVQSRLAQLRHVRTAA
jgi:cell division protein ZapA (FtsZ GTPase activity inhibitor)